MKTFLAASLALTLPVSIAVAQTATTPGWNSQQLTVKTLVAVAAPDTNTIVVVGTNGSILRSTDGGVTWSLSVSPSVISLYALTFSDAKNGTAVGAFGAVIRTEDGGATWKSQSSGTNVELCGVSFANALTGIAVGSDRGCFDGFGKGHGQALRTVDGGATWKLQIVSNQDLRSVKFIDSQTAIAVGDQGTVLRTTDAGLTWKALNVDNVGGFYDLFFTDAKTGIGVGGFGVARTTDGGVTWRYVGSLSSVQRFTSVFFSDANNGTAVGYSGGILRTIDGGLTWTPQVSGVPSTIYSVWFTNAITGYAVGTNGLLRTNTGGDPGPIAVSAASLTAPLAPESLGSLVGSNLTTTPITANSLSPPTILGGLSVRVTDSASQARLAPLFYVSPTQINFEVPPGTAAGATTFEVINAPSAIPQVKATVRSVAPALFVSADGKAVAYGLRVESNGSLTVLPPATPITLDERQVVLVLYATGVRNRSALNKVQATLGGINLPIAYAGPAGDGVPGLDQINIFLPAGLKGNTDRRLLLTVDGFAANVALVDVH